LLAHAHHRHRRTTRLCSAAPCFLKAKRINSEGPLLGVFSDAEFEETSMPLPEGARLLLYTDGLPELRNRKGQAFGEPLLCERLLRLRDTREPPCHRVTRPAGVDD